MFLQATNVPKYISAVMGIAQSSFGYNGTATIDNSSKPTPSLCAGNQCDDTGQLRVKPDNYDQFEHRSCL